MLGTASGCGTFCPNNYFHRNCCGLIVASRILDRKTTLQFFGIRTLLLLPLTNYYNYYAATTATPFFYHYSTSTTTTTMLLPLLYY